jgi:hypothetical protein
MYSFKIQIFINIINYLLIKKLISLITYCGNPKWQL